MWIVQGTSKVIKQQNTLSILSCTEEVTGIPNEAQHTSLFHMLKMPYFPHGASCTRNVTHATQLLPSSTLHSLPKKTYLQQQTLLQSLDCFYCILLSFICMQTWDDNNAHLYSDPCLTRSCWSFLCAGTWVIFWKPQANSLLDLEIPYLLKMCLSWNSSITAL